MNQFSNKKYNLEDRTAEFGEDVIKFCRSLEHDIISKSVIIQLIKSATSVGANYMEANGGSSRRDFRNKIYICKKEIQETKYWLRMMIQCFPDKIQEIKQLAEEAQELTLIFQKITTSLKAKNFENRIIENSMEIAN